MDSEGVDFVYSSIIIIYCTIHQAWYLGFISRIKASLLALKLIAPWASPPQCKLSMIRYCHLTMRTSEQRSSLWIPRSPSMGECTSLLLDLLLDIWLGKTIWWEIFLKLSSWLHKAEGTFVLNDMFRYVEIVSQQDTVQVPETDLLAPVTPEQIIADSPPAQENHISEPSTPSAEEANCWEVYEPTSPKEHTVCCGRGSALGWGCWWSARWLTSGSGVLTS